MTFFLICFGIFTDAMLYGMIIPILPSFAMTHALSPAPTCFIFVLYPISMLLLGVPIGRFTDRYGRWKLMVFGMLLMTLVTLVFAQAQTPLIFAVSRFLQGIAAAITWTAGLAWTCDMYPPERRGAKIGMAGIASGMGLLIGPVVGGVLSQWYGNELPFYVCAGLALLVTIGLYFVRPARFEVTASSSFIPWRNRNLLLACIAIALGITGLGLYEPLLPFYVMERFSVDEAMVGMLFGTISLAYILSQPMFGWLSDRFGRKWFVIFGFFLVAVTSLFIALVPSLSAVFMVGSLMGVGLGLLITPSIALISDIFSKCGGGYGLASAFYNISLSIGLTLGPLIGGMTHSAVGYLGVFAIYAVCMLLGGIGFVLVYESDTKRVPS